MTAIKLKKSFPYLIMLSIAIGLYSVASNFDFETREGRLGPDVWPKGILILMMLVSAYEVVKNLLAKNGSTDVEGLKEMLQEESAVCHETEEPPMQLYWHLLVGGIVLTAAYVFLMNILGFFLDTALYLAAFMIIGRYRKPVVVAATSVLGSLIYMFIFMKIVYLSLPIGQAPFSAVSLTLMQLMGVR